MSDGQIEIQGSISELRSKGILEKITEAEAKELVSKEVSSPDESKPEKMADKLEKKAAKKLVEEETREEGRVKWPVYITYIKASYVIYLYLS